MPWRPSSERGSRDRPPFHPLWADRYLNPSPAAPLTKTAPPTPRQHPKAPTPTAGRSRLRIYPAPSPTCASPWRRASASSPASASATSTGWTDLSGCDLGGGCFREARFGHARFTEADATGCGFQQAFLWGADLSGLRARGSFWQEADLPGSRLQAADFCEAQLHRACLCGVVAAASQWQGARLVEADFRSGLDPLTDLGRAQINHARLEGARLEGARLPTPIS